jgi:hypothetical protein
MQTTKASAQFTGIAPGLSVPDVRIAAEYYRDRLGFIITDLMEHFAGLERDGVKLWLWRGQAEGGLRQRRENPGLSNVILWVNDTDAVHREFVENSVPVLEEPEDFPYGIRHGMYHDLRGYVILTCGPLHGDEG